MMRLPIASATVIAALLMPVAGSATVLHFKGTAVSDSQTQVTFDVKGHTKKVKKGKKFKKVFAASTVSNVHVENQLFTCYDASGNPVQSGRSTIPYDFFNIPPMHVSKTGVFSGVYEFVTGGSVITRETFTGKIKNRTAKGTFQAQYDPGGIQYGYCGNMTGEPYTAKG
jgi:hypothetical protein